MVLNSRYSNHPEDAKHYTTDELREHFLIETIFEADIVNLTYSHNDRLIIGGIMPVNESLTLTGGKALGTDAFFDRREGGVINIGAPGTVTIDGETYEVGTNDGLYIGKGVKEIFFKSVDATKPAKFYFNSAPAHHAYPHKLVTLADANKINLGAIETANKRTINQYIVPGQVDSCQLVMGMTILDPGSIWNTMPCHTHERRMEAYLYFNMNAETRVMHFMGEPTETRHLVVANEQAIISPSWSIHAGAGTSNYTFIWGMCGENMTFDDMDHVAMADLR